MDLTGYYPLLRTTSLLRDMPDADLTLLLHCMLPRVRRYDKGEFLMLAGYETSEIGIVLEGSISALKSTPDGSSVVITRMGPGGLFGDVLSGSHSKSPVSILAQDPCLVIYLPYEKIVRPCASLHACHLQLLHNLISTISDKYFSLDRRVELLICKSLRARIAIWLLEEAERAACDTFSTPMTRAGLAEYLNCDRSALSRELGRMQREGLIETWRSSFKILNKELLQAQL